jgi:hypothetical protein
MLQLGEKSGHNRRPSPESYANQVVGNFYGQAAGGGTHGNSRLARTYRKFGLLIR